MGHSGTMRARRAIGLWRSAVFLCLAGVAAFACSCSKSPLGPEDNTWRFTPGHVERFTFAPFRGARRCWIYLPPGYSWDTRSYPVLYMTDGELVFDGPAGMHVDRVCESMIRRGEIRPLIVVAIENESPQR